MVTTKEFNEDMLKSMDSNYEELRKKLEPIFHDKTKYVNGKLLKDCFRHIGDIIKSHHYLRRDLENA